MSNDNLFLSENFDFIEESTPFTTEPLEFQDVQYTNISESKDNDETIGVDSFENDGCEFWFTLTEGTQPSRRK